MTPVAPAQINAAIGRASALLATDPAAAEQQVRVVLKAAPNDPRAALILASALRRLGDLPGARSILAPLAKAYPRAAHTQYELGLTLAALGEPATAAVALQSAVAGAPDMAEAWRALGDLLFAVGDAAGAQAAFAEHARAIVTDPALRPAADAVFHGDFARAEQVLRERLALRPNDTTALRMLAEAAGAQGRAAEAEDLLRLCLQADPAYDGARFTLADVLFKRSKGAEAMEQVEPLLNRAPGDPAYRNLAAAALALQGNYTRAIDLYEGLLAQFPTQAAIWLNYGHALRTTGRTKEAVKAYRECIAIAPGLGEAYWSLANLKTVSFSPSERSTMVAQLERPDLSAADRLHLHYALGKALEDQGDHAPAFHHYTEGARLRRAERPYAAADLTERVARACALFTPEFFARRPGGAQDEDPIFIVGLPRSGSTLVEQILASHSQVEGTHELPEIGFIAAELSNALAGSPGASYPDGLRDLDAGRRRFLGAHYLKRAGVYRNLGRRFFVDKMPNNFEHIGLIQLILPRSKIIDIRRHPLGSGFSAFKQHFAEGQTFSYDLSDIGRYYRDYVDLMRHYNAVLPGRVHRVIYEDLVENTEAEVRRLLAFCGLDFESGCLTFHQNDRAVRTVSSEQVRRPIFRDGLDQWRHYEPWLEPLKATLGPALERWRD
jgi:tetratricopeptide (TPR) repeat protein